MHKYDLSSTQIVANPAWFQVGLAKSLHLEK